MIDFKGHRIEKDIILLCVRWYLAYPLSYRHLEAAFRKGKKRAVGSSWRMDETYIKVKGAWKYLYRAVDKDPGEPDDLLKAQQMRAR